MKAVAVKKGQTREQETVGFQEMGALRCDACGEDFVIWKPIDSAASSDPVYDLQPKNLASGRQPDLGVGEGDWQV